MRTLQLAAVLLAGAALLGCQSPGTRTGGPIITHSTATGPGNLRHEGGTDMVRQPQATRMATADQEPEVSAFEAPVCMIYFDFDRWTIRGDQQDTIARCVRFYQENPPDRLRLEGHADERGSDAYNMNLGRARAISVRNALVEQGLQGTEITVVSYGEERPAMQGSGEAVWSRNRRVEFGSE